MLILYRHWLGGNVKIRYMTHAPILYSEIKGNGKVLVLLHGYLSSSHYFKHISEELKTTHKVISIDLLGFGKSPKPRGNYTYEEHVAALHATLEHLKIASPFTLLGHSMGALIALRYAVKYGDTIDRLLLFNPPLFTNTNQMIEAHKASGRHYRVFLYSPARNGYWKALKLVPHTASKKRPAINFTDTLRMSRHAREGSYRHILGGSELFTDLRKTTMPVLIVNGRYDRSVYNKNLEGKELPSNVRLETVETGHHTLVKNVELAERLIQTFVSSK